MTSREIYCDVCRAGNGWVEALNPGAPYISGKSKAPGMPCPECFPRGGRPPIPRDTVVLAAWSQKALKLEVFN